jgi:hypothetical protein
MAKDWAGLPAAFPSSREVVLIEDAKIVTPVPLKRR